MTREETINIEPGCKVYIWGNRDRAQRVVWRGMGTLGAGSTKDIRFETGMFFTLEEPELIDFAPDDAVTEGPDLSMGPVLIQNGHSPTHFFRVEMPTNNYRNLRGQFMIDNNVERSRYGYLVTYDPKAIEKFKEYEERQKRYEQYHKADDLFNAPPNENLLK